MARMRGERGYRRLPLAERERHRPSMRGVPPGARSAPLLQPPHCRTPVGVPAGHGPAEPLYVSAVLPARAPRRQGISGHHAESGAGIVQQAGVPTSNPVATWLTICSIVGLDELVVAADHRVLDPSQLDPQDIRPFTSTAALRVAVGGFHGRGARRAASALDLVRCGAESRPETLLRLLLQRAGLPEALPNRQVRDDAGRWLGRADLVYPEFRTVVEYDGDRHRSSRAR